MDGAGNAYVTGSTRSSDFPAVVGPDLSYNGDCRAAVAAKVNAAGTGLVYGGFVGGADRGGGLGNAGDGAGNGDVPGGPWFSALPAAGGPDRGAHRARAGDAVPERR